MEVCGWRWWLRKVGVWQVWLGGGLWFEAFGGDGAVNGCRGRLGLGSGWRRGKLRELGVVDGVMEGDVVRCCCGCCIIHIENQ